MDIEGIFCKAGGMSLLARNLRSWFGNWEPLGRLEGIDGLDFIWPELGICIQQENITNMVGENQPKWMATSSFDTQHDCCE